MDKIKSMLNTYMLANAVLTTLEESPSGFAESMVYVALNSNYDLSAKLTAMLERQYAIEIKGNWITKGKNFDRILQNARLGEAEIKRILAEKGIQL